MTALQASSAVLLGDVLLPHQLKVPLAVTFFQGKAVPSAFVRGLGLCVNAFAFP